MRVVRCLSPIMMTLLVGLAPKAAAQTNTTSGTLNLSLNIVASCAVNGGPVSAGNIGSVGTIAFPDQAGAFGDVTGTLVASSGAGGISVLCSPGLTPALTIGAGAHDAGSVRHLAFGTQQLTYRLFSDAGFSNELAIGQRIALGTATATAFVQPIFGRVNGGGALLPAGTYADTVQVTLSW